MQRRRVVLVIAIVLGLGAGLAWWQQSRLIGFGLRWYLTRVSADETRSGTLERRRMVVAGMHRALLMSPPPDAMVAELFDLLTLLGERMAAGTVPLAWGAYLYTGYVRDLLHERPDGRPERTLDEVRTVLDREVRFYAIGARPGDDGMRVRDLLGGGSDVYTKDEIEQAAREGRPLPLR